MAPKVTHLTWILRKHVPRDEIILTKVRLQVSIGFTVSIGYLNQGKERCKEVNILKIGKGDGCLSKEQLGFDQVSHPYIIRIGERRIFFAPLSKRDLSLKSIYEVRFGKNWDSVDSKHKFDLHEGTMRPAILLIDAADYTQKRLLFLGDHKSRRS